MKLALDTNAYSALARAETHAVDALRLSKDVALPLPVLAELRAGFHAGTRMQQNEALLQRFLNTSNVQILVPDEQTTFHYARVYAILHRKKQPLPQNDIWIAALVLQHDCVLFTYDTHFDHLPQIPRY